MHWSFKIAHVRGILIQVHWTFAILVAWFVMAFASGGADLQGILAGVLLLLAMFGCVVLHELGHALTAQQFDIPTKDITLLPIGGIARLERSPEKPVEEFFIAAAGPAVNVAIAAVLWLGITLTDSFAPARSLLSVDGPFFVQLMWINVVLVVFNLLPAFPMDGGRILRSLLAIRLDFGRATAIAALLGQAMAVLFAFFAFNPLNPFLLFIAVFVYVGARSEAQQVKIRSALNGVTVRDAMTTDFVVLSNRQRLGEAATLLLSGSQQDFPVDGGGQLVGMLFRPRLVSALKQLGDGAAVSEATQREFATVLADEPLLEAVTRLRGADLPAAPVLDGTGMVIGVLTMENVAEVMVSRSVLSGRDHRRTLAEIFATD